MGCHFHLQGIFLTQGSNPGLLPCRQILYHLSYQGSLQLMLGHFQLDHGENEQIELYHRKNLTVQVDTPLRKNENFLGHQSSGISPGILSNLERN